MNKQMKKALSLTLALLLLMTLLPGGVLAANSGTCGASLTWTLNSAGTLTISGTGAMEDYSTMDWPWNREEIVKVVIGNGVTSIGRYAFYGCSNLTSVTIPSSVTEIKDNAFYDTKLTSVTIPAGVTSIGYGAFMDCSSLTGFTVDSGNSHYSSVSGLLLNKDQTKLVLCPPGKSGAVTIPSTVTTIDRYTFQSCGKLTSVTIPASVTSIQGYGVFERCSSLTSINVDPANAEYCSIDGVLLTKDKTMLFTYPGGKQGAYAVPSGVKEIVLSAFYACSYLTSLTIPAGVESIGDFAFYDCRAMTSVTIPASLTSIGYGAFWECPSHLEYSVASANTAFSSIDGVLLSKDKKTLIACPEGKQGAYTVPSGVTSIAANGFYTCRRLTSVTLPEGVTTIGNYAFESCYDLTSVTLPASLTSIGINSFINCTALTDVYYASDSAAWAGISIAGGNEALKSGSRHYNYQPLTISSIKANVTSAAVGDTITWTGTATGGSGTKQYCFYIYKDGAAIERGKYGAAATYSYMLTEPGSYSAKFFVKDATGSRSKVSAATTATGSMPLTISSIKADKTAANVGDTITWTGTATGGSGTKQYCFYIYKDGAVIERGKYGVAATYSYMPTEPGSYSAKFFVKDASGSRSKMSAATTATGTMPLTISSIEADKTAANVGDTITWTASATGGSGTKQYCFYIYKDGAVIEKGKYGAAVTYSYMPTEAGSYSAKVFVKDASGSKSKMSAATTATGSMTPTISSIEADMISAAVGDTITWTAAASGGSGTLKYCFYVYKDGTNVKKGTYGSAKTFSYTPTEAGAYAAKVFVKDSAGVIKNKLSAVTKVTATAPLAVSSIKADKTSAAVGDTITWTATASGGSGTKQYCFYVYKDGSVVKKGTYGSTKTFSYNATAAGNYMAKVFVKDASGVGVSLLSAQTTVGGAPLAVSSIKADRTSAAVGDTITWTASATGGSGTKQYCFYVYKDSSVVKKGTYGSAKTFSYKASAAGNYTAKVFVKDASGSVSLMSAKTVVA